MADMDTNDVSLHYPAEPQDAPPIDFNPPGLIEKHVYISHGSCAEAKTWAINMTGMLEASGCKVVRRGEEALSPELLAARIKTCMKVIMLISKEYLASAEYENAISFLEQLTAERGRECLIPVLCGLEYDELPERLKTGSAVPVIGLTGQYPKAGGQYWKDIVNKIPEEIPVLSTVTSGVAYGLAWGYFFGYLHLILQGLSNRIREEYEKNCHDWDCGPNAILFPKMLAIIPKCVRVLSSLGEYDPRIQAVNSRTTGKPIKVKHTVNFPGHPNKDYSCTMFKTKANGKEYLFFAEVPTTLNTLAKMHDANCVEFSAEDRDRELVRFQAMLEKILFTHRDQHTSSRIHSIKIMTYENGDNLSEAVGREIERTLQYDRAPWRVQKD